MISSQHSNVLPLPLTGGKSWNPGSNFKPRSSVLTNSDNIGLAVLEESDEDDFDEALDNMSFAMSGVVNT